MSHRKTYEFNYGFLSSSVENHINELRRILPKISQYSKTANITKQYLDALEKDLITTKKNLNEKP